eukprot:CAMPEP_0119414370 /NCGR_PEP_ID=MMETSP1335-20130426/6873_1 /TAXON_ID=259385 /ORGANISM="Chrysoculter rhomboideus, Strain RCC1486" /LENGTH=98 /DNA_ID=CAMNT_0007439249 /DNA_START=39 /DNA_END=335 /DNA_ORIENTATION=+
MYRTVLRTVAACLLLAAVADAFQAAPLKASRIVARSQPTMAFEAEAAQLADSTAVQVTNFLLASKETDFGGYTGPAVGVALLALLLSFLANPYDDLKE